jgi:hypothetical protein
MFLRSRARPVREADNLTAICENVGSLRTEFACCFCGAVVPIFVLDSIHKPCMNTIHSHRLLNAEMTARKEPPRVIFRFASTATPTSVRSRVLSLLSCLQAASSDGATRLRNLEQVNQLRINCTNHQIQHQTRKVRSFRPIGLHGLLRW